MYLLKPKVLPILLNNRKIPRKKKKQKNYHGASLVAQLVKNPPAMQETLVQFLVR